MFKLSKLKPHERNPYPKKGDEFFEKLVDSISSDPDFMEVHKIAYDSTQGGKIFGGNKRYYALKELGYKEVPEEWVFDCKDWSEEQKRKFVIVDNIGYGAWDWDIVKEDYEISELEGWGMDVPDWGNTDDIDEMNDQENDEWVGMPEFEIKEKLPMMTIHFKTPEHREEFTKKYSLEVASRGKNTWTTYYPYRSQEDLTSLTWSVDELGEEE